MSSGALNFTLGLQANQFLNSLGASSGKLLGFLGVANGINAAFTKMWGSIEKGGALKDLAASASVTVKDLYQLQRGFKDVGASADAVPSILNRLRRTLAGGEQNNLLQQLGLDPDTIARMNPAAQFEKIAAAMARLNVNARSQAATALFGREGASAVMQIANSGNDFADAMKRAAADAGIWDNVSDAFDAIGDKVAELQAHIETMWAQLAGALIQAFNEGRLAELLTDIFTTSIRAAFDALPGLAVGGFVKLGELLMRIFQEAFIVAQTTMDYLVDQIASRLPGGAPASSFSEMLGNNRANTDWNIFGASLTDISDYANSMIASGLAAGGQDLAELSKRLGEFVSRLPQGDRANSNAVGGDGITRQKGLTPGVTSLEKIGFVFNGKGTIGSDHVRQTADNTRLMLKEQQKTNLYLAEQKNSDISHE
jgi:hypothetical protein